VIETVENFRDLLTGMIDIYLSGLSHKMNEVVKVLTIISTIFIPVTFIAGVYGMNFETSLAGNMPELKMEYGYVYCWLGMFAISGGLLFFFWKKGWLSGPK
jgi:magnesium transporter